MWLWVLVGFYLLVRPQRSLPLVFDNTLPRDKYETATLYALPDKNMFPCHEVRTYLVVKGERESFVTGEERSLRRDCYANG